jgi:hypothetical protein
MELQTENLLTEGTLFFDFSLRGYPNNDPDEMIKTTGKIMIETTDGKEHTIGTFSFYYLDIIPSNMYNMFDQEEQYLSDMASSMYKLNGEYTKDFSFLEYEYSLLLLDTVRINPEYRGKGILKMFLSFLKNYYENTVFLTKACPLDTPDDISDKEFKRIFNKVVKSYTDCRFIRVNKSSMYLYHPSGYMI